jgi:uncharacterized repeat protein (TIGR01451 family)
MGAVIAIAVMATVISTLGALVATRTLSNSGNITAVGVGVYSDSGCTTVLSSISWGTLNPGDTKTYTVYVKNTGTVSITLTMAVTNWNPSSASSYITLSWDRQNYVLTAGSSVQATLTLVVSSSISSVTSFTFDVTITGTQ